MSWAGIRWLIPSRLRTFMIVNLVVAIVMGVLVPMRPVIAKYSSGLAYLSLVLLSFSVAAILVVGPWALVQAYLYPKKCGVWYAWRNGTKRPETRIEIGARAPRAPTLARGDIAAIALGAYLGYQEGAHAAVRGGRTRRFGFACGALVECRRAARAGRQGRGRTRLLSANHGEVCRLAGSSGGLGSARDDRAPRSARALWRRRPRRLKNRRKYECRPQLTPTSRRECRPSGSQERTPRPPRP